MYTSGKDEIQRIGYYNTKIQDDNDSLEIVMFYFDKVITTLSVIMYSDDGIRKSKEFIKQ